MPLDHYVPQFYLRFFATTQEGRKEPGFWVYDKEDPKGRLQVPRNTAAIRDFHTMPIPESDDDRRLEAVFAELEGKTKPILARWQEPSAVPTSSEIPQVITFLSYQVARVPRAIESTKEMVAGLVREMLGELLADEDQTRKVLDEIRAESGDDLGPIERLREGLQLVDDGRIRTFVDPKQAFSLGLLHGPETVAKQLTTFAWTLCTAPPRSHFLTSDAPVCTFTRHQDGKASWGGGFGQANTEVSFPISPTTCLYLTRRRMPPRIRRGQTFVHELNRRTAAQAERYIISPFESKMAATLAERFAWTRKLPRIDVKRLLKEARSQGDLFSGG